MNNQSQTLTPLFERVHAARATLHARHARRFSRRRTARAMVRRTVRRRCIASRASPCPRRPCTTRARAEGCPTRRMSDVSIRRRPQFLYDEEHTVIRDEIAQRGKRKRGEAFRAPRHFFDSSARPRRRQKDERQHQLHRLHRERQHHGIVRIIIITVPAQTREYRSRHLQEQVRHHAQHLDRQRRFRPSVALLLGRRRISREFAVRILPISREQRFASLESASVRYKRVAPIGVGVA